MYKKFFSTVAVCALFTSPVMADSATTSQQISNTVSNSAYELKQEANTAYDKTKDATRSTYESAKRATQNALGMRVTNDDLMAAYQTRDIMGMKVFSEDRQQVGTVSNVLVSPEGENILVVSTGGFLGMGNTERAIYLDSTTVTSNRQIRLDMSTEDFRDQPVLRAAKTNDRNPNS